VGFALVKTAWNELFYQYPLSMQFSMNAMDVGVFEKCS
jgi:hypothetical protein